MFCYYKPISRPLRIEYPDAWYHVINCGRRAEENFSNKSKRGIFNEPRNVAIYLTMRLRGDELSEICKEFHMKRYCSASSAIERIKTQISKGRLLRERIEKLRLILIKSQT